MRLVQVVLRTRSGEEKVYWLKDDPYNDRGLNRGGRVILTEEGVTTAWMIDRLCCTVPEEMGSWLVENLKARMGTIFELY